MYLGVTRGAAPFCYLHSHYPLTPPEVVAWDSDEEEAKVGVMKQMFFIVLCPWIPKYHIALSGSEQFLGFPLSGPEI